VLGYKSNGRRFECFSVGVGDHFGLLGKSPGNMENASHFQSYVHNTFEALSQRHRPHAAEAEA
jgi:hypothetical protein